jgi:fatty acid desaturase
MMDFRRRERRRYRLEWPTLALAVLIYGGWLATTWFHARLPGWLLLVVGGWLVAWHGSLQHETIHGHPTGHRWIDALIGAIPLSLWLPYGVYRRSHLAHHAAAMITDPFEDPESRYISAAGPGALGWFRLICERIQAPLAGRLLFGPPVAIARFGVAETGRAMNDPATVLRDWIPHLVGVTLIVGWLDICGFRPGSYLLLFVYPGTALSLLRSFAEHRADPSPHRRVAIVERAGPFALLYLNNNLHAAHHRAAGLPWYRLPAFYRRHRTALLAANGGLLYRGYGDVARRFLFRAHDQLVHPVHRMDQHQP